LLARGRRVGGLFELPGDHKEDENNARKEQAHFSEDVDNGNPWILLLINRRQLRKHKYGNDKE